MRTATYIVVLYFVCALLCGCGTGGSDSTSLSGGGSRAVTDMLGRRVLLPQRVERAVLLLSDAAKIVYSLGAWGSVVGVSRYCYEDRTLCQLVPDINKLPSPGSGFDLNIEKLLALRPDVVVVWASTSSRSHPLLKQITERGVPVVVLRCFGLGDVYRTVELLGEVFGRRRRAAEIVKQMKGVVAFVRERLKGVRRKPKVIWLWTQPTRLTGGVGLTNDIIALAGGVNPAAKFAVPYATVSLEQIIAWNPEAIVIWESARYNRKGIIQDKRWRSVTAVRRGMVKKSRSTGLWCPEIVLKLLDIAVWLHPDAFKGVDIGKFERDFLRSVYGSAAGGN